MRSGSMFVKIFSAVVAALMLVASPAALHAKTSNPQTATPPNNSYDQSGRDKNANQLLSTYQKNRLGADKSWRRCIYAENGMVSSSN